jgi:hypothetical protein
MTVLYGYGRRVAPIMEHRGRQRRFAQRGMTKARVAIFD